MLQQGVKASKQSKIYRIQLHGRKYGHIRCQAPSDDKKAPSYRRPLDRRKRNSSSSSSSFTPPPPPPPPKTNKEPFSLELTLLFGIPVMMILVPSALKDPSYILFIGLSLLTPLRDIVIPVVIELVKAVGQGTKFIFYAASHPGEFSSNNYRRRRGDGAPPPPPPPPFYYSPERQQQKNDDDDDDDTSTNSPIVIDIQPIGTSNLDDKEIKSRDYTYYNDRKPLPPSQATLRRTAARSSRRETLSNNSNTDSNSKRRWRQSGIEKRIVYESYSFFALLFGPVISLLKNWGGWL